MDEQQVRAQAVLAAGAFAGAIRDPRPEDVFYAADLFAAYIIGGTEAALRLYQEHNGNPQTVELREEAVAPTSGAEAPIAGDRVQAVRPSAPEEAPNPALDKIHKLRQARAAAILREWGAAKVPAHRDKILRDMQNSGLTDEEVVIDGRRQRLGAYLRSQHGS